MSTIQITLKNYKCFEDQQPAVFNLRDGFVSFVGVNNSGKTSILKFFYEFRLLWASFLHYETLSSLLMKKQFFSFSLKGIFDNNDVFCNKNDRRLEIEFKIMKEEEPSI
jgi:AAA15 family ATPase/GTPase